MIRNLLDLARELADAAAVLLTRPNQPVETPSGFIPDTWAPEHIHIGQRTCDLTDCDQTGFHFHEQGGVYRTLAEYQAARREAAL